MQKSLDKELNNDESQELQEALEKNQELANEFEEIKKLNHLMKNQQPSFGDYFAEKVMRRIESLEQTTAGQAMIYAFYRIALPGLVAAMILVMISLFNSGSVSFDSISGVAELNSGYLSDFLLFNY
jgi:anti-sigma factor RsiW